MNCSKVASERSENVSLFYLISSFVSFGICIYVQQLFDSKFKQKMSTRVIQKKINCLSKEYVTGERSKF